LNDSVPIEHLVKCAAFYDAFGPIYIEQAANGKTNGIAKKFKRIKA
jgi:hypothetical protein